MIKPDAIYDHEVIKSLLQVIMPDPIQFTGQTPIFRTLTLKVIATLLMTLAFNKSCTPYCLN
jgi:hypothetical protein